MALAVFARMTDRLLAHLGEPARLRGEVVDPPLQVNIEHGVEVVGEYAEVVTPRSVATLALQHQAKRGDALALLVLQSDGSWLVGAQYVLDAPLADNGYSQRFVLRAA